jgi:hypothetical protein
MRTQPKEEFKPSSRPMPVERSGAALYAGGFMWSR